MTLLSLFIITLIRWNMMRASSILMAEWVTLNIFPTFVSFHILCSSLTHAPITITHPLSQLLLSALGLSPVMMKLVFALVLLLQADRHGPQHKEIYPGGGGGEAPEQESGGGHHEAGPERRLQCPVTQSPRTVERVMKHR